MKREAKFPKETNSGVQKKLRHPFAIFILSGTLPCFAVFMTPVICNWLGVEPLTKVLLFLLVPGALLMAIALLARYLDRREGNKATPKKQD